MGMDQAKTQSAAPGGVIIQGNLSELHYFAYGSDMNEEQIHMRCTRPVAAGVARLARHRLAFYGHSRTWDGGEETVIPDPQSEVWGVLYKLTPSDWERLDSWQDVRLDGSGAYFHCPAEVTDTQGKTHAVLLYKKDVPRPEGLPSLEYLDFIVQGALEHGLPTDYIEALRRMQSRKAKYAVPRRKKINLESLL